MKKSEKDNVDIRLERLNKIPEPLLVWYDENRRKLPWREVATPYRVWVSEIMLQQTRVEAVKPYFERFMLELPDIKSLAECREDRLLKLWEGLGYYNRVRNLQKAAIEIVEKYDGEMPEEYENILSLKGIGSYTAGAIASIAFKKPFPAVDGNVLRVVSRICMDNSNILDTKVKGKMEEVLLQVIPKDRPGDFNQAMMEIGACVCIPNGAPHCEACPLASICLAHKEGKETEYPIREKKKSRTIEEKTVLVIRDSERTAIHKRANKGLLAGLYELPNLEGKRTAKEVVEYLAAYGIKTLRILPLEEAKHIFTHKEWHMIGYMVRVDELELMQRDAQKELDWLYVEPAKIQENFPIPSAFGAYTGYVNIKLGNEKFDSLFFDEK